MRMEEKAMSLIEESKTVFLVTAGEGGRPDARAMASIGSEGLKVVWMATCKLSDKCSQLAKNPASMIFCASDAEDMANYLELRLWGNTEILDDPATRERMWREQYSMYFPGGKDDPDYCVLKFTAASGVLIASDGEKKKLAL